MFELDTIEKSELRSDEDGVRISCFYRSCQTHVIIHAWMGSGLRTLQAFFLNRFRVAGAAPCAEQDAQQAGRPGQIH